MDLVLDCNIWIIIITGKNNKLKEFIFSGTNTIYLSSYMVVEILKVLKRLSIRLNIPYSELETLFWDFTNQDFIIQNFDNPFSDHLIMETKKLPEIRIIAEILELEPKDVPYIVSAFKNEAALVTDDKRSLLDLKEILRDKIGIKLFSSSNLMELRNSEDR